VDIISIVGIGLVATVIAVLLRQYKPEYAMLVTLAAGVFILSRVYDAVIPVIGEMQSILESTSMPVQYAGILFKALGICFITQIACDTCRDAGESAVASKVEMAGKLAVLLVSLPLFRQVLTLVNEIIY